MLSSILVMTVSKMSKRHLYSTIPDFELPIAYHRSIIRTRRVLTVVQAYRPCPLAFPYVSLYALSHLWEQEAKLKAVKQI